MEPPPTFLKARVVAFSCILFTSLLWVVLLSVVAFWRWDLTPSLERSLIIILLCTNLVTMITVPLLLLLQFRVWLDVARLLFLLVAHVGSAAAFAYCNSFFTCPNQTTDQEGACRFVNMCILLACWVNPFWLFCYAAGLSYLLYCRSSQPTQSLQFEKVEDEEASLGRVATLPIIQPDRGLRIVVPAADEVVSNSGELVSASHWSSPLDSDSRDTRSSGRLSKPQQTWSFHAM